MPRFLLSYSLLFALSVRAQSPLLQGAMDAVSIDSLVLDLQRLSGELPVNVGGGDQLIVSRNKNNPGNALAADWLQQRIMGMGLSPVVQIFSGGTGENIIAEKLGAVHPERKVVVCGHYDAMPGGPVAAPAADDDGSGTCSVLEAMRVLAPMTFENTMVFAFWDEEEQGLLGSHFYAGVAAANDVEIAGAVNMDAISYDGDGDGLLRIHTRSTGNSLALKDTAVMVNSTYGLNLPIAINNPGATYSDHAAFWSEGYGAILVIEDFDNDGNPHYHTPTDLLEFIDQPYWQGLTKLAIGTVASLAVPMSGPLSMEEHRATSPLRVFPNPANSSVRVWADGPSTGAGTIQVVDVNGAEVRRAALVGPSASMDVSELADGLYVLRLAGNDGIIDQKRLLIVH